MTDGMPPDPWRPGDPATDLVREGAAILDALASTHDDGGRDLLPCLFALEPDDMRCALLTATLERWREEAEARLGVLRRALRRLRLAGRRAAGRRALKLGSGAQRSSRSLRFASANSSSESEPESCSQLSFSICPATSSAAGFACWPAAPAAC
jgi:hypothetical protein